MKRYYVIDEENKIKGSFSRPQQSIETVAIEENDVNQYQFAKYIDGQIVEDTQEKENFENEKLKNDLALTDNGMIRVIEDLINTLIDKNIIAINDLPVEAKDKINNRKALRDKIK